MVIEYDVQLSRRAGRPVMRKSVTYEQLWQEVMAVAVALRNQGIKPGDVVAIQLPTWHEYMVAHVATYAIGAVSMFISPIYRTRDVSRQLVLGHAVALMVPASYGSFDYVAMAQLLRDEVEGLRFTVVVGEVVAPGAVNWADLITMGTAPEHEVLREQIALGQYAHGVSDLMLLNFTSGTTGEPKGVMHSTATVHASVSAAIERMQLTGDDVLFISLTLGHAAGYLNGIYMPLLLGAKVIYMDLWDADVALHVIETERITYGPTMPTYLFDLVNHTDFHKVDVSSWRTARVSGGAIARPLMAALQERWEHLRLCPGWGMSEALYVTGGSPDDSLEKRNTTDGRPLDSACIEIRDSQFERVLPQGKQGEILVRSASVMLGYLRQEELTKAAKTADGWLKTGDLGYLDEEGFLVVVGRSKDLIIRGGENIPVVEVEQLLMQHEKIEAAVLIGIPDARLGEKVCAVVQCKNPSEAISFAEMQAYLIERQLTKQFIPEYLILQDQFPLTAVGKIRKQDVKKQILSQMMAPQ